jgi:hypothetical protein
MSNNQWGGRRRSNQAPELTGPARKRIALDWLRVENPLGREGLEVLVVDGVKVSRAAIRQYLAEGKMLRGLLVRACSGAIDWLEVEGPEGAEVLVVDGVRISRELFKFLADDANKGRMFQLVAGGDCPTIRVVVDAENRAATERAVIDAAIVHFNDAENRESYEDLKTSNSASLPADWMALMHAVEDLLAERGSLTKWPPERRSGVGRRVVDHGTAQERMDLSDSPRNERNGNERRKPAAPVGPCGECNHSGLTGCDICGRSFPKPSPEATDAKS